MSEAINKQLIDNISQLLKRSIVADSALLELQQQKKAKFSAIFTNSAGFKCQANTFQPYIEELADELLVWQKSSDQTLLIAMVKKIEQLFSVLTEFEKNYDNKSNVTNTAKHTQ